MGMLADEVLNEVKKSALETVKQILSSIREQLAAKKLHSTTIGEQSDADVHVDVSLKW